MLYDNIRDVLVIINTRDVFEIIFDNIRDDVFEIIFDDAYYLDYSRCISDIIRDAYYLL
jgi:hypothetical protein